MYFFLVSQLAAEHQATNRLTGCLADRQEKVKSPTLLHQVIADGSMCTLLLMPSALLVNAPHQTPPLYSLWIAVSLITMQLSCADCSMATYIIAALCATPLL